MDREQYLKRKAEFEARVSEQQQRNWCFNCRRKKETCLCHAIKTFQPDTIISLLMHPKEAKKQRIGTGYLTKACLPNARLFSDVNLDENRAFREFLEDDRFNHVLLYPDSQAWPIDGPKSAQVNEHPNKTLVLHLLDATWPCAKKMMRLSTLLQQMPRASFTQNYHSQFVIKHQPHSACLSTIETVFYCLEGLKKQGREPHLKDEPQYLLQALDALVGFQLKCEHDPNIPSNRGRKPKIGSDKVALKKSRIRPKKNRLFYWDVERSPIGAKKGKEK